MISTRNKTPKATEMGLLILFGHLRPKCIPKIVENSAKAFIEDSTNLPLRARMAKKATREVVAPEDKPRRRRDNTIGIPVKSNLRNLSGGKAKISFNPENFME